jgi:ribosomal protein S16
MRSMYRHRASDGTEPRTFEVAVAEDPGHTEASRYINHIGAYSPSTRRSSCW